VSRRWMLRHGREDDLHRMEAVLESNESAAGSGGPERRAREPTASRLSSRKADGEVFREGCRSSRPRAAPERGSRRPMSARAASCARAAEESHVRAERRNERPPDGEGGERSDM